ncbi:shikimate kinase [Paenibacillus prosopidis]|uniref:Shikimate kinase n=1 Tax=Paenibacillus prosopidis TaxID=630520 RepID=A0A368W4W4_9BACL|nr:shikimate kinase [Paenibacillus prosopidis]RCW49471.1 shikimate kinase [Paenibacillus prosopidis]
MHKDKQLPFKEKNIILIGFMGVGKTTIGIHIAKKLNRDFIDVDQEIEKQYDMPVTQIFKTMGEQKFRQMEKEFIVDLCCNSRLKIISLGGGAFLQEEIRNVCLSTSIVFFLDLSFNLWKDRLHLLMDNRPVLQNKTLEEIEQLYYSRQGIYALNHSKVNTDYLKPEEVADNILHSLKLNWEINEPIN